MPDAQTTSLHLGAKQSRIVASAITLVALCVLFVLGAAVFWLAMSIVDRYRLVLLPPIVAVILDLMAARRIHADQLLVESFSRLRSDKRRR